MQLHSGLAARERVTVVLFRDDGGLNKYPSNLCGNK